MLKHNHILFTAVQYCIRTQGQTNTIISIVRTQLFSPRFELLERS